MDGPAKDTDSTATPTEQSTRSRRDFLRDTSRLLTGAVVMQILPQLPESFNPNLRSPKQVESVVEEQGALSQYNWETVFQTLDQVKALETDPNKILDIDLITSKARQTYDYLKPQLLWLRQIDMIDRKREMEGKETLSKYYQRLVGGMDRIEGADFNPLTRLSRTYQGFYSVAYSTARSLLENKLSPGSTRVDWDDGQGLHDYGYNDAQRSLDVILREMRDKNFVEGKAYQCSIKPSIEIDAEIVPTPEGLDRYKDDKKRIEDLLKKYPFFLNMCNRIELYGHRYGKLRSNRMSESNQAGTWNLKKNNDDMSLYGVVRINTDETIDNTFSIELVFGHEAFGHGTDLGTNVSLINMLPPNEAYLRLLYQNQIIENKDWGDHDSSIPDLFMKRGGGRNGKHVTGTDDITTDEFLGTIGEYPRNVIYYAGYVSGYRNPTLADVGLAYEAVSETRFAPATRIDISGAYYKSLPDFIVDYLPKLQKDASAGNIRSKIILWGLQNFPKEFSNTNSIWKFSFKNSNGETQPMVPNDDYDSSTVWSNYCNTVVTNAVLYHCFLNNIKAITELFSDDEKRNIQEKVANLRATYRQELYAEGVGYSIFLQSKMKDKSPYLLGLEKLAETIGTRKT